MLVTCGFTTFNSEKTINRALASALEQDYKDIEILIVDDNSSDSTINKINSFFLKKDIRYKILKHKENLGVASARNTLLNNANGEFLAFFDSDDISNKDRVSKQVLKIQSYEKNFSKKASRFIYSPICYSDREIIFNNNRKIYCKAMYINKKDYVFKEQIIGSLLFSYPFPKSSESGSTATCMLCARVETLKKVDGFNSKLRRFEDLDLTIRAICNNIPICRVNKSLVKQFYTIFEYKKNEYTYEKRLIYLHRNWLKKKRLFKFAFCFIKFKQSILTLNINNSLYYFALLSLNNPIIFLKRIISSLRTINFTVKLKIIKNRIKN